MYIVCDTKCKYQYNRICTNMEVQKAYIWIKDGKCVYQVNSQPEDSPDKDR